MKSDTGRIILLNGVKSDECLAIKIASESKQEASRSLKEGHRPPIC